ncbi:MAG: hypothetical protein LBR36_01470 [Bacteroidales bacterium]|jgi:hypothetical protein|nr:hypothetical protein [Bacteroidales bacterium]
MKKILKIVLFTDIFILFCGAIFAQKQLPEEANQKVAAKDRGFDVFFDAGMYVGNKKNANYYRGLPTKESSYGDPNISYLLNNPLQLNNIMTVIEESGNHTIDRTSFDIEEISEMKYQMAFSFNIGIRYRLGEHFTIGLNFGQALLTARGDANFVFKNTSGVNVGDYSYQLYPIIGKERRNFFGLSLLCYFPTQSIVSPFIEINAHINSVKVKSADLVVENSPFSLINWYGEGVQYDPTITQTKVDPRLGGVGFGVGGGVGLKIAFTDWVAIEPMAQVYAEKANLRGYNKITPNYNFIIRLVVNDKVFSKNR